MIARRGITGVGTWYRSLRRSLRGFGREHCEVLCGERQRAGKFCGQKVEK